MLDGSFILRLRAGRPLPSLAAGSRHHAGWIPEPIAITARHLWHDRLQARWRFLCGQPLCDAQQRGSDHPYAAVTPRLFGHPLDRIVPVLAKLVVERCLSARLARVTGNEKLTLGGNMKLTHPPKWFLHIGGTN